MLILCTLKKIMYWLKQLYSYQSISTTNFIVLIIRILIAYQNRNLARRSTYSKEQTLLRRVSRSENEYFLAKICKKKIFSVSLKFMLQVVGRVSRSHRGKTREMFASYCKVKHCTSLNTPKKFNFNKLIFNKILPKC